MLSLLVQSTSLPWHQLDLSSYQGILGYVGTHYTPSLLLSTDSAPQLLLKLLRGGAGLQLSSNEDPHMVSDKSPFNIITVLWCILAKGFFNELFFFFFFSSQ